MADGTHRFGGVRRGGLTDLERQDKEKARILELKYFGGLTAEEMAGVLGITLNRVNWQIRTAQAWLRRELESEV
jgi:DNA-directed RNA polymerase specialized sigma24 family protein